jgi:hypothetical protein
MAHHCNREAEQGRGINPVTGPLIGEFQEAQHQEKHVGAGFFNRQRSLALNFATVLCEVVGIKQSAEVGPVSNDIRN